MSRAELRARVAGTWPPASCCAKPRTSPSGLRVSCASPAPSLEKLEAAQLLVRAAELEREPQRAFARRQRQQRQRQHNHERERGVGRTVQVRVEAPVERRARERDAQDQRASGASSRRPGPWRPAGPRLRNDERLLDPRHRPPRASARAPARGETSAPCQRKLLEPEREPQVPRPTPTAPPGRNARRGRPAQNPGGGGDCAPPATRTPAGAFGPARGSRGPRGSRSRPAARGPRQARAGDATRTARELAAAPRDSGRRPPTGPGSFTR